MRISVKEAEYKALLWILNQFDVLIAEGCADDKYVQEAEVVEDMIQSMIKKYKNAKRK